MTVSEEAVQAERKATAARRERPGEQQQQIELGCAWLDLVTELGIMKRQGRAVNGIKIRGKWASGDDFLVILTADTEDGPVVAFHGAENITTLWKRLVRRIRGDTLTWKDDTYDRNKSG